MERPTPPDVLPDWLRTMPAYLLDFGRADSIRRFEEYLDTYGLPTPTPEQLAAARAFAGSETW